MIDPQETFNHDKNALDALDQQIINSFHGPNLLLIGVN